MNDILMGFLKAVIILTIAGEFIRRTLKGFKIKPKEETKNEKQKN